MVYIDEKFKDRKPKETVEFIRKILKDIGIEVQENWLESGVENCYSLSVSTLQGIPSSNGKGVSEDLARASAYGEFIERLQGGLFFYKYQSITRNPEFDLQAYAPDAKYVSVEELIRDGEWMDYLITAYPQYHATRESIAELCRAYGLADDGKILVVPFYSLFEKKHVYLPIGFVDQMYGTNGCCVGNSREEAWVHAMSEMMERHAALKVLLSGNAAPKIPEDVLNQYPTISNILKKVRENGEYDVDVLDFSIGNGFPVIATRIISKKSHDYRVNVGADPVLEIAIQRSLTELFQGKNITNVTRSHGGTIMGKLTDLSKTDNALNQLETSSGQYTAEFFADELTCQRQAAAFADNSNKSNKELLTYVLDLYKQMDKPVYVRNFSYLGFPCYRFVVPGFSEALAVRMEEVIPQFCIADECSATLRNPKAASDAELSWMLNYSNMIRGVHGRYNFFNRISGIPISYNLNTMLCSVTRAYAYYRLGMYREAMVFVQNCIKTMKEEDQEYFSCVNCYLQLKQSNVEEKQIRSVLFKFYKEDCAKKLYDLLDAGKTPYDDHLVSCDYKSCDDCRYRQYCNFRELGQLNAAVGAVYQTYVHGQDPSEFEI